MYQWPGQRQILSLSLDKRGISSFFRRVPAEHQLIQLRSHLLLEGDVEERVDETVEVGRDDQTIQQSSIGVLLLLI